MAIKKYSVWENLFQVSERQTIAYLRSSSMMRERFAGYTPFTEQSSRNVSDTVPMYEPVRVCDAGQAWIISRNTRMLFLHTVSES